MNAIQIISILLAIIVAAIAVFVVAKTDLLKVGTPGVGMQYSFSKFQLFLWTLVICPLFVLHWGFHWTDSGFVYINDTALVLLGIAIATAVTSGGVDKMQVAAKLKGAVQAPVSLKAEGNASGGFWADILSGDGNQPSIHRLQNLLFTLVFIVIYIICFFSVDGTTHTPMNYPDFNEKVYLLMGISSGGYVLGKGING